MQLISNLLLCFKDVIPIVDVSLEFIPTRLSLPLGHLALYENQFVSPEGLTHDVSYQYVMSAMIMTCVICERLKV